MGALGAIFVKIISETADSWCNLSSKSYCFQHFTHFLRFGLARLAKKGMDMVTLVH